MPLLDRDQAFAIGRLDAHDQAALVARGEVSARELTGAAITRIEQLDGMLNILTVRDHEAALARAETATGPMAGVPWLLKESLDYPGLPNRSGSRSFRDAAPGEVIFPFTSAFNATGLVAVGKTNAPEFGLLPTTEPLLYGATRNPWALDRSPGGSSGGAAAAVASGMVPLAHAADGGGSIRIPASCCGLVGLKPGRGANLRARAPHVIEDWLVADTLLSRSVRDVAWATAIAAGTSAPACVPPGRKLRIAVILENLDGAHPETEVAQAITRTADLCASLGHHVEAVPLPVDGAAVAAAFRTVWAYLSRDAVGSTVNRLGQQAAEAMLEPWTLSLADWGAGVEAGDVDALFRDAAHATAQLDAFFTQFDLILSPVLRRPALKIGDLAPTRPFDHMMQLMFDYVSYTQLHNLTGNPAISLPLYLGSDGVPIGSMFAASRGEETLLLQLGFELEQAVPWADRWPAQSIAGTLAFSEEMH